MKISQFFVSGFLIAGSLISATPSLASCYGSGYARYCDGIGGPGATYSPRGKFLSKIYETADDVGKKTSINLPVIGFEISGFSYDSYSSSSLSDPWRRNS